MNNLKKKIVVTFTGITLLSLLFISGCHHHGSGSHNRLSDSSHIDHMAKELQLNQIQKNNLNKLMTNIENNMEAWHQENDFKKIIQEHIISEDIDEAQLKQAISEYFNQLETTAIDLVDDLGNFHNSLTSEQKIQLAQALEARNKGKINGRNRYH